MADRFPDALSKENIRKALETGTIRLITDPFCGNIAAEIGDNWFWFDSTDSMYLGPEEYRKKHTETETAEKIHDTLEDMWRTVPEDLEEISIYATILESAEQKRKGA